MDEETLESLDSLAQAFPWPWISTSNTLNAFQGVRNPPVIVTDGNTV